MSLKSSKSLRVNNITACRPRSEHGVVTLAVVIVSVQDAGGQWYSFDRLPKIRALRLMPLFVIARLPGPAFAHEGAVAPPACKASQSSLRRIFRVEETSEGRSECNAHENFHRLPQFKHSQKVVIGSSYIKSASQQALHY